jgi:hypothetical protein
MRTGWGVEFPPERSRGKLFLGGSEALEGGGHALGGSRHGEERPDLIRLL